MRVLVIINTGGNSVKSKDQLEQCSSFAAERGWSIIHVCDNQHGTSISELQNVLHEVDVVLTTELTRISNNLEEANQFLCILKVFGSKLYTVKDGNIADFTPIS